MPARPRRIKVGNPAAKRLTNKLTDQRRGTAASRGYGAKWRRARAAYLAAHPLCECKECMAGEIRVRAAMVVDHKIPHKGDMKLFWDRSNWQAMSKPCHDKKTASEDGGFGNPVSKGRAG